MKSYVVVVIASVLLCACAVTHHVVQLGPDTYSVSANASPVRGGSSGARSLAIEEAGNYCRAMGRQVLVENISGQTTNYAGAGSSDVTFMCLAEGDPALHRPRFEQAPNVVIEDRRR